MTLSRAQPYSQSLLCGPVPITGPKALSPSIPLSPLLTLIPGKEVTEGHVYREMLFVPLSSVSNFSTAQSPPTLKQKIICKAGIFFLEMKSGQLGIYKHLPVLVKTVSSVFS